MGALGDVMWSWGMVLPVVGAEVGAGMGWGHWGLHPLQAAAATCKASG